MITVVHGPEWMRIRAQLRKEAKTLDEHLQRAQRLVMEELVKEAQAKVRAVQVQGGPAGRTGLRRRVAASVTTVSRGGMTSVSTHMRDRDERNLPLGLDRPQGWSHPLFGNKSRWYRERPVKPGWFSRTFDDAGDQVVDKMEDELEQAVGRIARAGNDNRFLPG
jgi:hypothetical protein